MLVITYRLAYQMGEVSLCAKCDHERETTHGSLYYGPLGCVSHGAHEGVCDRCADEACSQGYHPKGCQRCEDA